MVGLRVIFSVVNNRVKGERFAFEVAGSPDSRAKLAEFDLGQSIGTPVASIAGDAIGNRGGHKQSFFLVQVLETLMPSDVETIDEFQVGITELRDSLGFTVQEVARSGTPVVIRRFRKTEVILVPLAEWRRLKQLETDLGEPDPFDFDDDESDDN